MFPLHLFKHHSATVNTKNNRMTVECAKGTFSSSGSIVPGSLVKKKRVLRFMSHYYLKFEWVLTLNSTRSTDQNELSQNELCKLCFFTFSYSKERLHVTPGAVTACQRKCVGKTAGKDPVSTGHSCAGFRVSGMLTAFWTTSTLLWQAKSYYPTWDSPVALLKPSNMLSFKCVCACMCVCLKTGREGQRVIQ